MDCGALHRFAPRFVPPDSGCFANAGIFASGFSSSLLTESSTAPCGVNEELWPSTTSTPAKP